MNAMDNLSRRLNAPVDAAGLVWFRVIFGIVIAWEMSRYFWSGWMYDYWVEPVFNFTYWPFTFVQSPGEPGIYLLCFAILAAGITFAIGWRTRMSAAVIFVGMAWLMLMDKTRYLNHIYLTVLLAFLCTLLPTEVYKSRDVQAGRVAESTTVPTWSLWLVRFMIFVPYFFGGIAKINADWLAGEPMRAWIADDMDYPLIGRWFDTEAAVWFFSGGGLLFDLMVVPLLLWRRTRVLGLVMMMSFHVINMRLFKIGIFPFLMILATLVFLPPDWPRKVWADVKARTKGVYGALVAGAVVGVLIGIIHPSQPNPMNPVILGVGMAVLFWEVARYGWDFDRAYLPKVQAPPLQWPMVGFLAVWVAVQVILPFRHLWIDGNVHWTEEGHRWAWHMKLRSKKVHRIRFIVQEPGKGNYAVDPADFLARHQTRKMATHPVMNVQFAHFLVDELDLPEGTRITVDAKISLHGREPQPLVDPNVDLLSLHPPFDQPASWIVHLRQSDIPPPDTRPVASSED